MDNATKKDIYRLAERLNIGDKKAQEAIESATQIFAYGIKTGINLAKFNLKPMQQQEMKENAVISSI